MYNDNKEVMLMLAKKYNTSYAVIKEVVESPFAFMYDTLRKLDHKEDELPDFHIPRLGRFKVKYGLKKNYKNEDKKV